jgi:hypothetical protein
MTDLRQRRMHLSRSFFVAYFIRFPDHANASEAAQQAVQSDGWGTAQYSDSGGRVLRVSRQGQVRKSRLEQDWEYVAGVAAAHGGECDGIVIEDLSERPYWVEIASRLVLRAIPESITDPELAAITPTEDGPVPRPRSA